MQGESHTEREGGKEGGEVRGSECRSGREEERKRQGGCK